MPESVELVKVVAPWSERVVAWLASYQRYPYVHPYTCGDCRADLTPHEDGWHCDCGYRQDWARVPNFVIAPLRSGQRREGE